MDDEQLATLWAKKACALLEYDDAYPDVGMGMFHSTALDLAAEEIFKEAALWNSVEALRLDFKGPALTLAEEKLRKMRR